MKNSRRSGKHHNRRFNKYILICAFIALFAIILAATGMFVQASERSNKIYTSIEIQEHDTLWDIANTYCDTNIESVNDYIDNLKSINNISSDQINSGNYIIVYKYQ